jgi:hypothetical protein
MGFGCTAITWIGDCWGIEILSPVNGVDSLTLMGRLKRGFLLKRGDVQYSVLLALSTVDALGNARDGAAVGGRDRPLPNTSLVSQL